MSYAAVDVCVFVYVMDAEKVQGEKMRGKEECMFNCTHPALTRAAGGRQVWGEISAICKVSSASFLPLDCLQATHTHTHT